MYHTATEVIDSTFISFLVCGAPWVMGYFVSMRMHPILNLGSRQYNKHHQKELRVRVNDIIHLISKQLFASNVFIIIIILSLLILLFIFSISLLGDIAKLMKSLVADGLKN